MGGMRTVLKRALMSPRTSFRRGTEALNFVRMVHSTVPRNHVSPDSKRTSSSQDEMDHFNQLAATWWDVDGPQRILHKMNLVRMDFIRETIRNSVSLNEGVTNPDDEIYVPGYSLDLLPKSIADQITIEQEAKRDEIIQSLPKLRALDIGCGGGLVSESLARLKFISSVRGLDLSQDVISAAKIHKALDPAIEDKITYELKAVEDLADEDMYEIITMFEMLEHVNYPNEVLNAALKHLKPNGWLFISTINRDFVSWFTTIFVAESILKIVPPGTHHLDKYIKHEEIVEWFEEKPEFEVVSSKGCFYFPFQGWSFTGNPDLGNYFMAIRRTK